MEQEVKFGRIAKRDPRDAFYPIRSLLSERPVPTITHRYWSASGWWGDQGATSQCVAYAWCHWLEDGPVTHKGPAPIVSPEGLYHQAKIDDDIPGENYEGTTVRGGATVLQNLGFIKEYRWATTVADVLESLLTLGPVVMGTDWFNGMMNPDREFFIHPTGGVAGGHAYVLDGVDTIGGKVRVKNSWGRGWGNKGFAWMSTETLGILLSRNGEACVAIEAKP